jgi:hypothetical protein
LYLYGPDPLCPYLLLYYTLHPSRKLPFSGQCERLSRRLVVFKLTILYYYFMFLNRQILLKRLLTV